MIYEKTPNPGSLMMTVGYIFLEAVKLRRRLPDSDEEVLTGYGVGDRIDVIEPATCYPYASPPAKQVTLQDGSVLLNLPPDLRVVMAQS